MYRLGDDLDDDPYEPTIEGIGAIDVLEYYKEDDNMNGQEPKPVSCKGHRVRIKLWYKNAPIAVYDRIKDIMVLEEPMPYGFTSRKGKSGTVQFTSIDGDAFVYICNQTSDHEVRIEEKFGDKWELQWNSGNK